MVKEIKDQEFYEIIKNKKIIIDCYAPWCGPCKALSPIIDELSKEIKEYKFYKLNIDENRVIPENFGIMMIPTILIFENGELKNKQTGFISKEELEKLLD